MGLVGITGTVYEIIVLRRMQTQTAYSPEFEDWLCHVVLPFLAYAALAGRTYGTLGGTEIAVRVEARHCCCPGGIHKPGTALPTRYTGKAGNKTAVTAALVELTSIGGAASLA